MFLAQLQPLHFYLIFHLSYQVVLRSDLLVFLLDDAAEPPLLLNQLGPQQVELVVNKSKVRVRSFSNLENSFMRFPFTFI